MVPIAPGNLLVPFFAEKYKRGRELLLAEIVNRSLLLTFASHIAVSCYLDGFYYENAPREPAPAEGRIHPEVIHHGAHVFLTKRELLQFQCPRPLNFYWQRLDCRIVEHALEALRFHEEPERGDRVSQLD